MFKKKKVIEENVSLPPEHPDGNVITADITPESKGSSTNKNLAPDTPPEDLALLKLANELKEEYGNYLTPTDIGNLSFPVIKSEEIIIQAALYGELRKLVDLMQETNSLLTDIKGMQE